MGDKETGEKILATTPAQGPGKLQELGREVTNYDDKVWAEKRYGVVLDACRAKFSQNDGLKAQLLETKEKTLVEAAWYDLIWGVGFTEWTTESHRGIKKTEEEFDAGPEEWKGENLLGGVLMQVREEL